MRTLLFAMALALPVFAAGLSEEERKNLASPGEGWKLPEWLGAERLGRALQKFTKEQHGKAFRYLGVPEDFSHGHLLLEKQGEKLKVRAILYHTQEYANEVHWLGKHDRKFDYVDVTTRNWIHWLDDDEFENARKYADASKVDLALFDTPGAAPKKGEAYTINSAALDPKKLGFVVHGEITIDFYDDDCSEPRDDVYKHRRGPARIDLPDGKFVCLSFATHYGIKEL